MTKIIEDKKELEQRLEHQKKSLERSAKNRNKMSTEIWKLLIWKRAEPIYKNFDEQISSASKLDWEIKSAETNIGRLIEDFEAIEQFATSVGRQSQTLRSIGEEKARN